MPTSGQSYYYIRIISFSGLQIIIGNIFNDHKCDWTALSENPICNWITIRIPLGPESPGYNLENTCNSSCFCFRPTLCNDYLFYGFLNKMNESKKQCLGFGSVTFWLSGSDLDSQKNKKLSYYHVQLDTLYVKGLAPL